MESTKDRIMAFMKGKEKVSLKEMKTALPKDMGRISWVIYMSIKEDENIFERVERANYRLKNNAVENSSANVVQNNEEKTSSINGVD